MMCVEPSLAELPRYGLAGGQRTAMAPGMGTLLRLLFPMMQAAVL